MCLVAFLAFTTLLLGRAIQPDRTVQGHLFRAALVQNPTSKPSVLTEYSGSKQLSRTQQCNGLPLISIYPLNPDRFEKMLIYHSTLSFKGK